MLLSPRILLLAIALFSMQAWAEVISETVVILKEDGREHLIQRGMRSDHTRYDLYLPKHVTPEQMLYMHPNQYTWDDSEERLNRLQFEQGTFMVMYPSRFDEQVSVDEQGIFTFQSWQGEPLANGHFGSWNEPGYFTRYAYYWVLPENIELVDYSANREGLWQFQSNTLSFFASNIN